MEAWNLEMRSDRGGPDIHTSTVHEGECPSPADFLAQVSFLPATSFTVNLNANPYVPREAAIMGLESHGLGFKLYAIIE